MAVLSLKIPEDLAAGIGRLAAGRGESIEQQAETLLRWSLGNFPGRENHGALVRRIVAMTPQDVKQIPAEELLREDRMR